MTRVSDGEGRDYGRLMKDALIELDRLQSALAEARRGQSEPIAVVGMGCRFPAGANSPDAFWTMLRDGVEGIGEVSPERWNLDAFFDPDREAPGKVTSRRAGLVDQSVVEQFAPGFFGIAPREAEKMDPQQRVLLEVCWEALEDAAVPADRARGSRTGLFVGSCTDDYLQLGNNLADPAEIDGYSSLGTARSITVGRVSYVLGLEGPAVQLDTACSSSLVAVHQACGSLRSGECEMALAGGVNLQLTPVWTVGLSKLGALSPRGRCRTFDAGADGFVRGEGCGVVVLKRLSDALAGGDRILALIRATAVNHDGRSSGLTVPSQSAQEKLLAEALQSARLGPEEIDYVEAHGTGTSLGDPIEMGALGAVFGSRRAPLWVGSVKTNIGHLEASAGIAGLIKVILALGHEEIPPHLHFERPNPHIPWSEIPVRIPTERTPWPRGDRGRLAGVSAFGFSGTNAHLIVEEAPAVVAEVKPERPCCLLPISAKSPEALCELAGRYAAEIEGKQRPHLADVCFTAATGRSHFVHRAAVTGQTRQQVVERLRAIASDERADGVWRGAADSEPAGVAFLFGPVGSQHGGMGRELCETEPTVRKAFEQCEEILEGHFERPLGQMVYAGDAGTRPLSETAYGRWQFALQYALGRLWQSWGVRPQAVIGEGVGEYAAACVAGVFSVEDGLKLVTAESRIAEGAPEGEALDDFRRTAETVAYARGQCKLVSALTGRVVDADGEIAGAEYWCGRFGGQGRFSESVAGLVSEGIETYLEMGPPSELLGGPGASARPTVLASLNPDRSDWQVLLGSLSALYVTGQAVDWAGFARGFAGEKISLPTYPFQRQRYWLKRSELGGRSRPAVSGRAVHPLLGRRIHTAAAAELVQFETSLSASAPAYLADHRVHETAVLPATACMEMALAAGRSADPQARIALEDVVFHRAMILPEGETRTVQTVLTPETSGGHRFELFSSASAGEEEEAAPPRWLRHASGRLERSSGQREAPDVSLEAVRGRLAEEVPSSEVYARIAERGFRYGETFQSLRRVWCGPREALGYVAVPEDIQKSGEAYGLHPALLDACLHTIAGIEESQSKRTVLPVALERLEVFSRPGAEVWSHARLRETDAAGFTADVDLIDPAGAAVARLQGLRLHEVDLARLFEGGEPKSLSQNPSPPTPLPASGERGEGFRIGSKSDDRLYEICWRASPADGEASEPPQGDWLLLADETGVAEAVAGRLGAMGQRCVLVFPSESYGLLGAGGEGAARYGVRPEKAKDFVRLVEEAFGEEASDGGATSGLRGVVDLWSLGAPAEPPEGFSPLHRLVCGSALHLVQALSLLGASPRVWLATRGGQAVGDAPPDGSYLAQAPLWGLGGVIAAEYPEFRSVRVDLDPAADCGSQAETLLDELACEGDEDQVAYRGGRRYAARLVRLKGRPDSGRSIAEGSWLITGGLGALGLEVAGRLVTRGVRHLVLTSRGSPATPGQREAIGKLEAGGCDVRVLPADVADGEQVQRLLDAIESERPPLVGVVHTAGELDDGMLRHQDWPRFERVMRAKVAGAWHLHRLTKNLDYFVVFSSAGGLLGSLGQGSYASANAFLDALARYRRARGEPGLSIAWGPWADLGMTARMRADERARLAEIGFHSLSVEEGLEAFEELIRRAPAQVAAMRIDWDRLAASVPVRPLWAELAGASGGGTQQPSATVEALREAPSDSRLGMLVESIGGAVAEVLGRGPASRVGPRQKLFDLGMDSLMSVELQRRMEQKLGISLPLTLAFDYPNVEALAEYVLGQLNLEPAEAAVEPGEGQRQSVEAERLAAMSDEDVQSLLAEKYKDLL